MKVTAPWENSDDPWQSTVSRRWPELGDNQDSLEPARIHATIQAKVQFSELFATCKTSAILKKVQALVPQMESSRVFLLRREHA
jgi:hypothetical protein